jgi:hypothetical protein
VDVIDNFVQPRLERLGFKAETEEQMEAALKEVSFLKNPDVPVVRVCDALIDNEFESCVQWRIEVPNTQGHIIMEWFDGDATREEVQDIMDKAQEFALEHGYVYLCDISVEDYDA